MRVWHGLSSKTSPVDSTPGISESQYNTRLLIAGECQRRPGMIASGIAQQSGRILMIASSIRGNFLTFDVGGGEMEGVIIPDPPIDGPKKKKPDVVAQDPGCATGGVGTGDLSVSDLAAFGTCTVSGSIACSANCCYRVLHTIQVTAVKTYTGSLGPHDDFRFAYDMNTTVSGGGTCGAATSSPFVGSVHDNQPANFTLNVDGYICSSVSSTLAPSWSFTCTPNAGPGDVDRYDWTVSVSSQLTNVLCAACHP